MAKVLVTAGTIGNYVAEGLANKGIQVRILVRRVTPNPKWEGLGIQQVAGEVADVNSLGPAFDEVNSFFSVTPLVENLVELGVNAIAAAKKAGVAYLVRSSAIGASEQAITMGRWHREVEKAVETSGIPYTILQPNTFMQSYVMSAESIKKENAFYLPQGEGKVSLVDAQDIAEIAVACLSKADHKGQKYMLTGPEALSNADIAAKLTRVLGKKITYVDVSPTEARQYLKSHGMPEWMVKTLLELFEVSKAGYLAEISPVVQQVLKRPARSFDQFLRQNAAPFTAGPGAVGAA